MEVSWVRVVGGLVMLPPLMICILLRLARGHFLEK